MIENNSAIQPIKDVFACILPAVVVGHDYVVVEVEELEQVEVGNRVVHGEAAAAIAVVRPR